MENESKNQVENINNGNEKLLLSDVMNLLPDADDRDNLFGALQSINMSEHIIGDELTKDAQMLKWWNILYRDGFTIVKRQ